MFVSNILTTRRWPKLWRIFNSFQPDRHINHRSDCVLVNIWKWASIVGLRRATRWDCVFESKVFSAAHIFDVFSIFYITLWPRVLSDCQIVVHALKWRYYESANSRLHDKQRTRLWLILRLLMSCLIHYQRLATLKYCKQRKTWIVVNGSKCDPWFIKIIYGISKTTKIFSGYFLIFSGLLDHLKDWFLEGVCVTYVL